jgi:hypothetical protein
LPVSLQNLQNQIYTVPAASRSGFFPLLSLVALCPPLPRRAGAGATAPAGSDPAPTEESGNSCSPRLDAESDSSTVVIVNTVATFVFYTKNCLKID